MKKPIKLSINNPCSEDWNKMTKNSEGRFCALCQKNVVDFTSMSDEEIKNYFLNYKGVSLCGRLKKEQLEPDLKKNNLQNYFINLYQQTQSKKPSLTRYFFLLFLGAALFLGGCNINENNVDKNNLNGEEPCCVGELVPNKPDTSHSEDPMNNGIDSTIKINNSKI
jgi:hypothetical protein